MHKALFILVVLAGMSIGSPCQARDGAGEKQLIQVKPSYQEASYVPHAGQPPADPYAPAPPTPQEQMYIFWILGKAISYPFDKAEEYIRDFSRSRSSAVKPAPASAASSPNPFQSVNWKEIPPAPPVSPDRGRAE